MIVVRELINRISFKIDPADKKNAENAFEKMKVDSMGVIGFAGAIGNAFKLAAGAVTGVTTAGTAMFREFEQNTGTANFLAATKEQAKEVTNLLDQIAEKSGTTSKREARRASATLQSIGIQTELLKDFIPFIEKISIAQPKLDFTAVAESLKDVIRGGDLGQLENLVPGIRTELEKLEKTTFSRPFNEIFAGDRARIVLDRLLEAEDRIDELVADQQDTLNLSFVRIAKETSDFLLNYGKTVGPDIKDASNAIAGMIRELNESERFWNVVRETVEAIKTTLQLITGRRTIEGILFGGEDSAKKIRERAQIQTEQLNLTTQEFGAVSGSNGEYKKPEFMQRIENIFSGERSVNVNFGGEIKITGQYTGGFDQRTIQQFRGIVDEEMKNLKQDLRTIAAERGTRVATGN